MNNIHNQSIPTEVLTEVKAKLEEAIALIKPHAIVLNADDRSSALKVGEKLFGFVTKTKGYTHTNPEFVPIYMNVADFEIDFQDANGNVEVTALMNQLKNYMDDTTLIARSEAYNAALFYYSSIQQGAAVNLPGAKAIYDDLKQYFAGRGPKASDTTK